MIPDAPTFVPRINQLISERAYREALALVDQALGDYGWFHLYLEKKAEILEALGDLPGAIRVLAKARQVCPAYRYLEEWMESLAFRCREQEQSIKSAGFCGIHERVPDSTGSRKAEGGTRLHRGRQTGTAEAPLVSIVTAVYNNPHSLERCIASVLRQDYPNIEHIIVDGGSDDPTLDIIRKYEDRIGYFVSEPDKGIYHAMNKGIRLAGGDYVCLLNSDDSYDPTFVRKAVDLALSRKSMLVFTDYIHGHEPVRSRGMNQGILLGHLHINHGTFLVHRRCYDLVGPYDEEYRIVSDAVWMREAYKKGVRFDHLEEPLFHFATGGLSAGNSPERRLLFISEVVKSYRREFGFLTEDEAEKIYLARFSPHRLEDLVELHSRHASRAGFREVLKLYVEHCLRDRDNFRFAGDGAIPLFQLALKACRQLGVPVEAIRMETGAGCFSEIISSINRKASLRKKDGRRVILHFLTVFSAPSETFIYDLLMRMEAETPFDNFVLHEHALLADKRVYSKAIHLHWGWMRSEARDEVIRHLFETLQPALAIGHFALNSWKLHRLINRLGIHVPILSMTHGIDVFSLKQDAEYRKFVVEDLAQRPDARFTAVSGFLRGRLIESGVAAEKIDLVHNTVHPRFFANRKMVGFRKPGEPLKLLAVGRLIDWKGHQHLVDALAIAGVLTDVKISLTIVYGGGDELLADLRDKIGGHGLESRVELVPFVDFSSNPGYYSQFDLFIHPSTYSQDALSRTETFGVAVLEAIAAGLPVICSDAGGIPEVVGEPNRYARIVPHGDAKAMADAMLEMLGDPSCFSDNRSYAEERLAIFSGDNQLKSLLQSIYSTIPGGIRVALFSTITRAGAGYAAYRLHRGLIKRKRTTPKIYTADRSRFWDQGVRVVHHPTLRNENWKRLQTSEISKPNLTIFTLNVPTLPNGRIGRWVEDADVINIHWSARFLTIENIAYLTNLGKPVIITLRDMFPLTGGCHFFHGCDGWTKDCMNCPQLVDNFDNYPAKVLAAKRRYYNFENLIMVALSEHSAAIIRRAPMFRDCRIEVIPNSIETHVFTPRGRKESRRAFGLPENRPIIAYVPSFSSEVKGYREATEAFRILESIAPGLDPLILLLGSETPATAEIHFEKRVLDYIHENDVLAQAYSAADLVIVPSLEETFSNTTAEAISCGTPVVGFRTGAIPQMVTDGVTGYCLEVGDVEGFARGMASILRGPDMGPACRAYAEEYLAFELQAGRYEELFFDLLADRQSSPSTGDEMIPSAFPETSGTILSQLENWVGESDEPSEQDSSAETPA